MRISEVTQVTESLSNSTMLNLESIYREYYQKFIKHLVLQGNSETEAFALAEQQFQTRSYWLPWALAAIKQGNFSFKQSSDILKIIRKITYH